MSEILTSVDERRMACPGCCCPESPLSRLLCPELSHALAALETLRSSAQEKTKQQTVEEILHSSKTQDYMCRLRHLLRSTDSRRSSAAACLLGVLVEGEEVLKELQAAEQGEDGGSCLVGALGQLLTREETDVVTNAAGAMASLVDTPAGREWLIRDQAVFDQVVVSLLTLLEEGTEALVNSAVLILARLSLCEVACQALLRHPSAPATLGKLVQCLAHSHTDTSTKAAFAVGRLCGSETGRGLILAVAESYQLVVSLQAMLSEYAGPEAGQAACFALSCLVTEEDGHALVLGSPALPCLLDGLLHLLKTDDQDSAWFAAMALKVFITRPAGVPQVREHKSLETQLKTLSCSPSIGQELWKEVKACLRKLERLAEPSPPTTRLLPSGACMVSWEKCTPESGLEVQYSLQDEGKALYQGPQCSVILPSSVLSAGQQLSLRLVHSTCDGDISPGSQPILLVRESEGGGTRPGLPRELRVIGCTATQVRLGWVAPPGEAKPKAYQFYREGRLLGTTMKLGAIVGGLSPGTQYQLAVCAVGPGDEVGPRADVEVHTAEGQDHAPSGLTMVVRGRHELQVMWGAPLVPLGRLFNYELRLNGHVAYLGTERAHTARHLAADTAYTCTVTAITARGRCQSLPATKRTARDEYQHTQRCLYSPSRHPPQRTPPPPSEVTEVSEVKRKVTQVKGALTTCMPKSQMSGRRHTGMEHSRECHRNLLAPAPSPVHNSNKMELPDTKTEASRLVKQQSCPVEIQHQAKVSPDTSCQWCTRRGQRNRGRLPPPNVAVAVKSVKLVSPLELNWKGNCKGWQSCLYSQDSHETVFDLSPDQVPFSVRLKPTTGPRGRSEIIRKHPLPS